MPGKHPWVPPHLTIITQVSKAKIGMWEEGLTELLPGGNLVILDRENDRCLGFAW